MSEYQVAVIVGSLRKESLNRRLAQAVTKLVPRDFSFKHLEIGDLPLYNRDDDANPHPSVRSPILYITGLDERSSRRKLINAFTRAVR
jgi:NAD(P)H-dependent FMN reductase